MLFCLIYYIQKSVKKELKQQSRKKRGFIVNKLYLYFLQVKKCLKL